MNTHSKAKLNTMMRANASSPFVIPPCSRKPMRKLTIVMMTSPQSSIAVSATARPESTALRGILRDADRGAHPLPDEHRREDPGDDEVNVSELAGSDRSAEDVSEDDEEHHSLHRGRPHQLRRPKELEQAPPGDHRRARGKRRTPSGDRSAGDHLFLPSCFARSYEWLLTAVPTGLPADPSTKTWPVSARNTSSSLGGRSATSSRVMFRCSSDTTPG